MLNKVLLVNHDGEVADEFRKGLQEAQLAVLSAHGVSAGLNKARFEKPSVIVFDLSLPRDLGLELSHQLKADHATGPIPIVILAPEANEEERIRAFEAGADDFVTQPFSFRQIILRVKNSINGKPTRKPAPEDLVLGDMRLNLDRHEFTISDELVNLTPIEFKLMTRLMEKRGQVVVRDMLLDVVWEINSTSITRTIDTTVSRLRRKLGQRADYLKTVRGVGYRLSQEFASPVVEREERKPKLLPPVALEKMGLSKVNPPRQKKRALELAAA